MAAALTAERIDDTLTRFCAAFNDNDLDRVMSFFADDAEYQPGDGRTHRGRDAIRAAFAPQFARAYGAMRFDEEDRSVDVARRTAAMRWVCRHDITAAAPPGLALRLRRAALRLWLGPRFGWQGVDVFRFDDAGRIAGKYTYGAYGLQPLLRRELG